MAKHYFGNPDVVRLCTELARRKHRVSVVTCFRRVDRHTCKGAVDILEVKPLLTVDVLNYPLSFPFSKIYRIVEKQGVDIVHALNDLSTNTTTAASVSWLTEVPFVYTIQGINMGPTHLSVVDNLVELYDWTIERLIAARARKVIFPSKYLVSGARKLGVKSSKIVIIPCGVDYNYFDPERPEVRKEAALLRDKLNIVDDIVVGYVGRLISDKGLKYLIWAIKQIQREYPNIVLLVVGDGPQRGNFETMVKDSKVKAIFIGWQDDVLPYYAVMDIFVLPSLCEGVANVMLEAMAMKKAIVATDVGGNPDLVVNGENGFLVPVADYQRIAFALKKLIENGDLRRRMGAISRQIVKKTFSWETIVPKVEKVYDEVYADEN